MSNSFEEYLLKEYNVSGCVCVNIKYSHSSKQKIDKASKRPVINNIITVKMDCYDSKHNLLSTHSEKFVDGCIKRSKNNKLVNIAPAELNNRFAAIKQDIANKIMAEYLEKADEINEKINSLKAYIHVTGVIPNEFVNEPAIGDTDENNAKTINEKKFEF